MVYNYNEVIFVLLSMGQIGKTYKVCDINLDKNAVKRFEMLGMTHNSHISVISKNRSGAMIIYIRGTRFAIGKSFAEGISVAEVMV